MHTGRTQQTPPAAPLVPVRFPPGETVLPLSPFRETLFAEVDRRLAAGVRGFFVKPVHARVSCVDAEFEIVCFGGASVRVNCVRTRRRQLEEGDRITLGRARFEPARKAR